jgi:hypothetical protein
LNVEKWWMVNFKRDRLPRVHIVDRYLTTVEHLGVKNDGMGLDLFIPRGDEVTIALSRCRKAIAAATWRFASAGRTSPSDCRHTVIELAQLITRPIGDHRWRGKTSLRGAHRHGRSAAASSMPRPSTIFWAAPH